MDTGVLLVFLLVAAPLALYLWYVVERIPAQRRPRVPTLPYGHTGVRVRTAGKYTFVEAAVPDRRGVALAIAPEGNSHRFVQLPGTTRAMLSQRVTPELMRALIVLGDHFVYAQAGSGFVSLELRGGHHDRHVLDAAIRVVGSLAQPAPVVERASRPAESWTRTGVLRRPESLGA